MPCAHDVPATARIKAVKMPVRLIMRRISERNLLDLIQRVSPGHRCYIQAEIGRIEKALQERQRVTFQKGWWVLTHSEKPIKSAFSMFQISGAKYGALAKKAEALFID